MISVAIITKNEASRLATCLESVSWATEKIVVDCGSTDETVNIAEQMGAKVWVKPWTNYGEQKQFAADQCTQEWVLSLDADEHITPELQQEIQTVLAQNPTEDGFYLKRANFLYGKRLKYGGVGEEKILRLFRRGKGNYESRALHEYVAVSGSTKTLKSYFEHHTLDSLQAHWQKIMTYTDIEAVNKPRYSWWKLMVLPSIKFFKLFVLKRGFLDGYEGYMWAKMSALSRSIRTFKAYQKRHK